MICHVILFIVPSLQIVQDMELKANETDKLIKGMKLKPTDDTIKYDWNTEAHCRWSCAL